MGAGVGAGVGDIGAVTQHFVWSPETGILLINVTATKHNMTASGFAGGHSDACMRTGDRAKLNVARHVSELD